MMLPLLMLVDMFDGFSIAGFLKGKIFSVSLFTQIKNCLSFRTRREIGPKQKWRCITQLISNHPRDIEIAIEHPQVRTPQYAISIIMIVANGNPIQILLFYLVSLYRRKLLDFVLLKKFLH